MQVPKVRTESSKKPFSTEEYEEGFQMIISYSFGANSSAAALFNAIIPPEYFLL